MRVTADVTNLGHLQPGDHVCWLVDDPSTYVATSAAILREGGDLGQKTVAFGPHGSPVLAELGQAAAMTADPHVVFLDSGPFDPDTMFAMFREQSALARAEGYEGLRLVADMDWLLSAPPTTQDVVAFEVLLDRLVAELRATVVCAYRCASFDTATLSGALAVHRTAVESEPVQFRFVSADGGAWRLSGEVDLAVSGSFAAALHAATSRGRCVIDIAGLAFVDVAGMRVIAQSARSSSGIELRGACRTFRRVWQLSGYDQLAPTVEFAP